MHYLIISYSHKNSDIAIREKLAFDTDEKLKNGLSKINDCENINEAIILSTCNRVEIIASVKNIKKASNTIFNLLHKHSGISLDELEGRGDIFDDNGALHHLFCVASSLDSLVIGETQISGQLKDAFKFAFENGYCSQKLSRALHFAFRCAAEVRNTTDISKNPVSVASAAVAKAKALLGELGGDVAVVIGIGEMGLLTIKHLSNLGCNIVIANRDVEKAKEVAREYPNVIAIESYSKIKELINRYKILFTATGAPHTIITDDMVEERNFSRFWFDMAVPRDIDNITAPNVNIFTVDDLKDIVKKNMSLREEQARVAYGIVGRYTMEFYKWMQSMSVDPIIKEMRALAKESSERELEKALSKGHISKEQEEVVKKILHNAFNSFLHEPTKKLKDIAEEARADTVVEAVKLLFGIEKDVLMLNKYKCEEHFKHNEGK